MAELILTNSQVEGLQTIFNLFINKEKIVVLQGSAGTGKTFLLQEVIKEILYKYGKGLVAISAPTHKALSVLKDKITIQDNRLSFDTIHALLKMKRFIDEETGEEYFAPQFNSKNPPLKSINYLIVDEASMIDSYMLSLILKYGEHLQVLFVGDEKQLNPVNETDSPVFMKNYPTFTLTEIVRQSKDNPIIQLSNNFTTILSSQQPNIVEGKGYIFTDDYKKIIERVASGNFIYLAYTNEKVDEINNKVRFKLFHKNCDIQPNETIVLQRPYGETLKNNDTLKVTEVTPFEKTIVIKNKKFSKTFKFKAFILKTQKGNLTSLQNSEKYNFLKAKKELRQLAQKKTISWLEYTEFVEIFADFKFGYATSIHKSQGSTFTNVILDISNVNINKNKKEKNRLIYTGITRASQLVVLSI